MKKLITVTWSVTVVADVPEGADLLTYNTPVGAYNCSDVADSIIRDASDNLNWKDGEITDVQDAE